MRYLKIKTLPTTKVWVDKDYIMLHACFQLLVDAVEQEKVDTHFNYEAHKDVVDEIRFLYHWWVNRTDENDLEDDKMLIRLINIRKSLWT